LSGINLIWRPDTPIGQPGGCGIPAAIAVSEIAGVRINPPATMSCEFAVALNSWVFQTIGLSNRGNFLRRIRKEPCRYFNTVPGSGSDAYHKDYLHVDMMRPRPGRFKLCRRVLL
jgi:hypothetical protein